MPHISSTTTVAMQAAHRAIVGAVFDWLLSLVLNLRTSIFVYAIDESQRRHAATDKCQALVDTHANEAFRQYTDRDIVIFIGFIMNALYHAQLFQI